MNLCDNERSITRASTAFGLGPAFSRDVTLVPQFKSIWAFEHFEGSVLSRYRFVHTIDVDEFLAALTETCASRIKPISEGSVFWRAQLGGAEEQHPIEDSGLYVLGYSGVNLPFPANRMKPLRHSAHEGRANPKGIPCLYLATDKETAVSEVRPWVGATISVASFQMARALRIVDCSAHNCEPFGKYVDNLSPAEDIADYVWSKIDSAFSRPVNDDLAHAEYVPTQIIAERLRQQGLDGVLYKSRLGPGSNLALFDLDSAEVSERILVHVEAVSYKLSESF